nr:glycosyltransferase [bacterium]
MTLSLVIPVYNEEYNIKRCLTAIAGQTIMPDEVIVVDNNCVDKTIEIAKSFGFVTVVKEPKQGRTYA